jgi:hypothetical protein
MTSINVSGHTIIFYPRILARFKLVINNCSQACAVKLVTILAFILTLLGAAACNNENRCNAFGIFFERSPMYKPAPDCPNPSSTTLIKCTLWSGTTMPKIGTNDGQIREKFHIVMAGSNAYVKDLAFRRNGNSTSNILKDWIVQRYDNGAAIQVPLDCNGVDTYMGMSAWRDGRFDAQRCLDACKVAGDNDIQGRKCRFVNTYIQRRNGIPVSQHCAMFSEYWPAM